MEKQKNCSKPKSKAKNQPTKKTNIGLITYAIVVLLLVAIGIGIWQAVVNKDKLTNKFKQITTTTATAPEMAQCAGCEHSHNDYGKDLNIANNPLCAHQFSGMLAWNNVSQTNFNERGTSELFTSIDFTKTNLNLEIDVMSNSIYNYNILYKDNNVQKKIKASIFDTSKLRIENYRTISDVAIEEIYFCDDNEKPIVMDMISIKINLTDLNNNKLCLLCQKKLSDIDCLNHDNSEVSTIVNGTLHDYINPETNSKTYNYYNDDVNLAFRNKIDSILNELMYRYDTFDIEVTVTAIGITGSDNGKIANCAGGNGYIFGMLYDLWSGDTINPGIVSGKKFNYDIMRYGTIGNDFLRINSAYFSSVKISVRFFDNVNNQYVCSNCLKVAAKPIIEPVKQPQALPTATADIALNKIKGLEPLSIYLINNVEKTADVNGNIAIEKIWYNNSINIIKKGNEALANSDAQVLAIPAEPTPDPKPDVKPDPKPEVKPDPTPDPKPSDPVITAPTTPSDTQLVMDWFKNYWIWIVVGFGTLIALSVGLPLIKKMVR